MFISPIHFAARTTQPQTRDLIMIPTPRNLFTAAGSARQNRRVERVMGNQKERYEIVIFDDNWNPIASLIAIGDTAKFLKKAEEENDSQADAGREEVIRKWEELSTLKKLAKTHDPNGNFKQPAQHGDA